MCPNPVDTSLGRRRLVALPLIMRVQCHVYDLSNGIARSMSMAVIGKQIDVIPHTGIVVFGREYFYGGGVCMAPPGTSMPMPACEVIDLGETTKTESMLHDFLASISGRFTASTYDLLRHVCSAPRLNTTHTRPSHSLTHVPCAHPPCIAQNCNHFSNEVVNFLTNGVACVPARTHTE